MYLMIVNRQIVSVDDLPSILQILGEAYGKAHFSIREYVIQARLPGDANPKPLVALLNKQYPTTFVVFPVLPFSVPANKE